MVLPSIEIQMYLDTKCHKSVVYEVLHFNSNRIDRQSCNIIDGAEVCLSSHCTAKRLQEPPHLPDLF